MHDIYSYGMISTSTVHILDKGVDYPAANGYAEIARTLPSIGGEAINSAVTLARLGLKVKFDGNWLNPATEHKNRALLEPYGMDLTRLTAREGFGTEEVILADRLTRTCFGNYQAFHRGEPQWNTPAEEDIRNCTVAVLDPYFRKESQLAAELCVRHQKPYVTLDCKYDDYITRNAEAVVISHELRDGAYPGRDMTGVFDEYLKHCRGLVIFTFGHKELWYARPGEPRKSFTPYSIEPVDTTGAGDSFRGAIAYGVLKGYGDLETIRFASAVAALVCTTYQHALNAPELEAVKAFMEEHKS